MYKSLQKILWILLLIFFHLTVFANPNQQKELTVVLDWFINPNHAPLFVADQEGFFAKYNLKVKFIVPSDATEGEKMVAVNRADIAVTYQPALVYHVVQGLPVIRFATLIDKPLNCLVTLSSGPIHSLKDLKGKRIGSSAAEIDNLIFSTMLEYVGLSLKDVNTVNVGFNLTAALLTKKIDGFVGGMRNFEPQAIAFENQVAQVFYPEKYGFPKYEELILVANKNRIQEKALVDFTHALQEGVAYLRKNPQKSWRRFASVHPELNNSLNKTMWFASIPYFASYPAKLDRKLYQKLAQFMWRKKQITRLPKVEEYAVEIERNV